jgi:MoaA/NifB/PqqE/SkfB family radical SAM enzyme
MVISYIKKKAIAALLKKATNVSDKTLVKITKFLEKFGAGTSKSAIASVREMIEKNTAGYRLIRRIVTNVAPVYKEKLIENLITQGLIMNYRKRLKECKKGGTVPTTVLISPTMRCNLRCVGCYAGNYSMTDDLPFEVVDRIIREGKKLGVAFFTFLGGEPFVWPHLFKILEKHKDAFFQVYTNSTLITEETAKRLLKTGNALPILSIEGFEKRTDERRGKGVYKKIMNAMDILKKHQIPFGFSAAVTSRNAEEISSDKFVDFVIEKGAYLGWFFLYMPVGAKPDPKLMPMPKQRLHLYHRDLEIRKTKPIFIIDFWNDAPWVGGCIAGKEYVHITSKGDVEPCIFTHMAVDNIKNKSLREVLNSDYFKALRARQPYHENLFLPCQWIDHPEVSREMEEKFHLYPTHPGADDPIRDPKVRKAIDKYSKEIHKLYEPVWKKSQFCNNLKKK